MNTSLHWPPPYTLRRSKRARHISMKVSEDRGLELVVPYFVSQHEALVFLQDNKHWLEKHADKIIAHRRIVNQQQYVLPNAIQLLFAGEDWTVNYIKSDAPVTLRQNHSVLLFTGSVVDFRDCIPSFKRWLKRRAKVQLTRLIQQLSHHTGLSYSRLSFREQKTVWGTCSEDKDISLNCKLLFLPYPLVRYVLLHELCHTVHLNHSKQFWQLVANYESNYKSLAKSLKDANQFIPGWYAT